jgi:cysteine desulfurase / selenocysteine lyase
MTLQEAVMQQTTTAPARPHQAFDTLAVQDVRQRVVGLDVRVPLLDGSSRPYINFDNAASTPAFWDVTEALELFLPWYASVHRGSGFKSQVATDAYDDARATVARFFGAGNHDGRATIFVKNTTEAINKAARRIPLGGDDVVLVSLMEHHSNDLPWRPRAHTVHIGVLPDGRLDLDDVRRKFAEYGRRVKVLAISGASNVTGYINPIHELAELAHAHGAAILVDAAQLAPHRAINMLPLADPGHIDFLAASGHKLYAPYGSGVLIGPAEVFAREGPDYSGGGTVEIVTEDEVYWNAPPERDEAGSPNVLGAVAMAVACRVLSEIGMDCLAAHEAALTRYALAEMRQIEGIEIYGDADPDHAGERLGVIPFNVKGLSHYLVGAVLGTEYGIGVRNGCFCAHPYVLHLLDIAEQVAWSWRKQVVAGVRAHLPGLVRVSFGCYNSVEEVDWLVRALRRIAAGQIAGDYEQDPASGHFTERSFRPDMAAYFKL